MTARSSYLVVRPRHGGAVRIGRVGGRHDCQPRPDAVPESIDGAGQPELGATETFDEVAAPYPAGVLHGGEDGIEAGESARDALPDNSRRG